MTPFRNLGPFAILPARLLVRTAGLSKTALRVLIGLASFASSPTKWVRVGHAKLAERTGYAIGTVRNALRELWHGGLLERRPRYGPDGGQRCNSYMIAYGAQTPAQSTDSASPRSTGSDEVSPCSSEPIPLPQQMLQLAQRCLTDQSEEAYELARRRDQAMLKRARKWLTSQGLWPEGARLRNLADAMRQVATA